MWLVDGDKGEFVRLSIPDVTTGAGHFVTGLSEGANRDDSILLILAPASLCSGCLLSKRQGLGAIVASEGTGNGIS